MNIKLSNRDLKITAGDLVTLGNLPGRTWLVEEIEASSSHDLVLRSALTSNLSGAAVTLPENRPAQFVQYGRPQMLLMDLPALSDEEVDQPRLLVGLSASPWARQYSVFASTGSNGFVFKRAVNQQATTGKLLSALQAGPTGRLDRGNTLRISLSRNSFESRDMLDVLNGRNVIGVVSKLGTMEIIQFAHANLLPDGTWELSGLLRSVAGTGAEMEAGADPGADVVVLDQGLVRIDLQSNEVGIVKNWRGGPAAQQNSSASYASLSMAYVGRTREMYRPVHLRGQRRETGWDFSWIRAGRIDSDNWDNPEIPLDAANERYLVRLVNAQDQVVREETVLVPSFSYSIDTYQADFGGAQQDIVFAVAQLSNTGKPGPFASINL